MLEFFVGLLGGRRLDRFAFLLVFVVFRVGLFRLLAFFRLRLLFYFHRFAFSNWLLYSSQLPSCWLHSHFLFLNCFLARQLLFR